jgi:predicted DsbA family dithiol-disulfide isomerase
MIALRLDVWSDIACPWCYIGKRRLEAALKEFPERAAVQITWRSFELNPSAPRESNEQSYAERLAEKYGTSQRDAEAMIERVSEAAKVEGLQFDYRIIRPSNTFDAHRLLHLAKPAGLQDAMKERLFRAYFCEGQCLSDQVTLLKLGKELDLDPDAIRETLSGDRFVEAVRGDEAEAQQLGIHAVPCFVFAERFGVSGAQPKEVLLRALHQAWQQAANAQTSFAEGAVCGADGC